MVWRDKPYLTFFGADGDVGISFEPRTGWSGQRNTGGEWHDITGGVSTFDGFVQFRGTSGAPCSYSDKGLFFIDGNVECYGNVWTLCGEDVVSPPEYAFYSLFEAN